MDLDAVATSTAASDLPPRSAPSHANFATKHLKSQTLRAKRGASISNTATTTTSGTALHMPAEIIRYSHLQSVGPSTTHQVHAALAVDSLEEMAQICSESEHDPLRQVRRLLRKSASRPHPDARAAHALVPSDKNPRSNAFADFSDRNH